MSELNFMHENISGIYNIKKHTAIIILCRTENLINKYITKTFFKSIPKKCYITLTDLNDDCPDIFKDIPSFVLVPTPLDFTITSHLVFENVNASNVKDIKDISYIIYPFYDILFTLNSYSELTTPLTIDNYVKFNPFVAPSAWSVGLTFDTTINGSHFGTYLAIFTKNVLVDNDINLFKKYNSMEFILPESCSLFRTTGIAPFFRTEAWYCEQNYYKVLNKCKKLAFVRFDINSTNYNGKNINTSEFIKNMFMILYDDEKYFTYLKKINNIDEKQIVNKTMSKKPIYLIL